jgi:hypothetical protein
MPTATRSWRRREAAIRKHSARRKQNSVSTAAKPLGDYYGRRRITTLKRDAPAGWG